MILYRTLPYLFDDVLNEKGDEAQGRQYHTGKPSHPGLEENGYKSNIGDTKQVTSLDIGET
jgi:hypothetical protein